jgi:hypothetical protein
MSSQLSYTTELILHLCNPLFRSFPWTLLTFQLLLFFLSIHLTKVVIILNTHQILLIKHRNLLTQTSQERVLQTIILFKPLISHFLKHFINSVLFLRFIIVFFELLVSCKLFFKLLLTQFLIIFLYFLSIVRLN